MTQDKTFHKTDHFQLCSIFKQNQYILHYTIHYTFSESPWLLPGPPPAGRCRQIAAVPAPPRSSLSQRELFLARKISIIKHCLQSSLTIERSEVVELLYQPGDRLGCQFSGHVPVEGAGSSSLLRMTQDIVSHCEVISPLLCVEPAVRASSLDILCQISHLTFV